MIFCDFIKVSYTINNTSYLDTIIFKTTSEVVIYLETKEKFINVKLGLNWMLPRKVDLR